MAGLMMTVAMLGAVGGQAPLSLFIHSVNWRTAMEVIALIGLGLAFLFWIVVRDKESEQKKEKSISGSNGLWESLRSVLQNRQSWWLSIYSGFAFAPVMVFGGLWGVSFTQDAFNLSHTVAAQAVSLIFIGFAVGAPVFGWFSDLVGKRRAVMFWGTLLSLVTISAVIYAPSFSHLFLNILLFLFGFSISSFLLCFTMIQELHAVALAATAIGFMNAFDAFFGAFSDPLAGKILDMHWSGAMVDGARVFSLSDYQMAFIVIPIYLVIALISLKWIKETHPKKANPSALP
jgi:sugar phosphate permease